eukprot:GCRY01002060.1.p1 GENE.GCRY01002060.1~~GCRY01002060.1.p1  ORF type:complete len:249 (+),score=11.73 GCRY01002060.1:134-880(+)
MNFYSLGFIFCFSFNIFLDGGVGLTVEEDGTYHFQAPLHTSDVSTAGFESIETTLHQILTKIDALNDSLVETTNHLVLINETLGEAINHLSDIDDYVCGSVYPGSRAFQGQCYYYESDALTWDEAYSNCLSLNMALVEIYSQAVQDFLFSSVVQDADCWIALRDTNQTHVWTWASDDDVVVWEGLIGGFSPNGLYTGWYATEPNCRGGNEWCAACRGHSLVSTPAWNDKRCETAYSSVCMARPYASSH